MATPILAQPSTAAYVRMESHRTAYIEEFTALAQEIQEAEGIGHIEALGIALSIIDELAAYAAAWDGWAFWDGNDDAMPF